MKTINVIKPFVLTSAENVQHTFAVGSHEVEDWIAEHWFTKAHSEPVKAKPAAKPLKATAKADDNEDA